MSKTDYFKILESIGKDEKPSGPNDRILIVDGLNTFIRSFAANPVTNEDGIHVGGMTGFLFVGTEKVVAKEDEKFLKITKQIVE